MGRPSTRGTRRALRLWCVSGLIAAASLTSVPLAAGPAAAATESWTLAPYGQLGAWVDHWDWTGSSPTFGLAHVDAIAARGVRTLYLQGARSTGSAPLDPTRQRALIDRAHQRGMAVVTWFLPNLLDPAADRARALALATQLPVDGLALDIESDAVADPALRSARVVQLAAEVDAALAGPVGAIVPAPIGMEINSWYWPGFPWAELGAHTGVWLPMTYWTYRPQGSEWAEPRRYVSENIRRLRSLAGEPYARVHVLGDAGLRRPVVPAEIDAMWLGASEEDAVGASVYDVGLTHAELWEPLARMSFTDPIQSRYAQLGGPTSLLGSPVSGERSTPDGAGAFTHYQRGSIYWSPFTGAQVVLGAIRDTWASLGWERSALRYPSTGELPTPDGVGRYNHFQNGSIYWTPSTGAREVRGSIRGTWSRLGWERSVLGYPLTNETGTPDGVGRFNHFERGSVYWTPSTGAREVRGSIRGTWSRLGWERSVLGYPLTNETGTPDGVGRFNHFERGSVYWTPSTGAREVRGSIRGTWSRLGWERSVLGYPLTNETGTPDGVGRFNHFERGSVYWTPSTGAREVRGSIRGTWSRLGWERSVLGYPLTNETGTPDGVGRFNDFQRGSIYWTPSTGAWEVRGAIRDRWRQAGAEASPLGYPTSDQRGTADGVGRTNSFERGAAYWTAATGAVLLHGPVYAAWVAEGAEAGDLGYPVRDTYVVPEGEAADFESGTIIWNSTTGETTILGKTAPPDAPATTDGSVAQG
jgi:uncharacterized protein with LGFP repeats